MASGNGRFVHRILCTDLYGSKCLRPEDTRLVNLGDHERNNDEDFAFNHDQARELLTAAIGCENTLQLILAVEYGSVTASDFARYCGCSHSTILRRIERCLKQAARVGRLAVASLDALKSDKNGATINPKSGEVLHAPLPFWAVSFAACEERHHDVTLEELCAYIRRFRKRLFRHKNTYLGLWFDNEAGEYCLDVTKLFPLEAEVEAHAWATRQKQKAMTCLTDCSTVPVQHTPRRRRAS